MSLSAVIASTVALASAQASANRPIEVPFRIGEDAIIVDAVVNGRQVALMFDTGFSGSVILNTSINVGPASGTIRLRDFVGEMEAKTVRMRSLRLGQKDIDVSNMEIIQKDGGDYSFSYNTHVDGIMGLEVISHAVTEINFERQKFIFHPDSYVITKKQPDNRRTFLARLLPKGNNSLEMLVEASNGRRMTLALDTGNAFFATTHRDVLERVGLWEEGRTPRYLKSAFVASGEVPSWYKRVRDVRIYGVPVSESVWSIIDLPSSSAEGDGTIGFQFLRNFNITIDYARRRVWLENFTGEFGNKIRADVGISAFPDPRLKRFVVVRVSDASPAERAGIRRGDHLLAIDGVEISGMGFRRVASLLEGDKGTSVALAVSRNGELMRFNLEREYLFNE